MPRDSLVFNTHKCFLKSRNQKKTLDVSKIHNILLLLKLWAAHNCWYKGFYTRECACLWAVLHFKKDLRGTGYEAVWVLYWCLTSYISKFEIWDYYPVFYNAFAQSAQTISGNATKRYKAHTFLWISMVVKFCQCHALYLWQRKVFDLIY